MKATRTLAKTSGILGGYSTGANVFAAVRLATELGPDAVVVALASDTGLKYLSTDLFGK